MHTNISGEKRNDYGKHRDSPADLQCAELPNGHSHLGPYPDTAVLRMCDKVALQARSLSFSQIADRMDAFIAAADSENLTFNTQRYNVSLDFDHHEKKWKTCPCEHCNVHEAGPTVVVKNNEIGVTMHLNSLVSHMVREHSIMGRTKNFGMCAEAFAANFMNDTNFRVPSLSCNTFPPLCLKQVSAVTPSDYLAKMVKKLESGTAPCYSVAEDLAFLLLDAGRLPQIYICYGPESGDPGQGIYQMVNMREGHERDWGKHFVCVCEGLAYDPFVSETPLPVSEYAAKAFTTKSTIIFLHNDTEALFADRNKAE